jgi:hypothetical protein
MNFKLEEIYNLSEGIGELAKKEMPTKVALRISRNQRKLIEEVRTADVLRQKLIEKYRDEKVKDKIKEDKQKEFKEEFDELMSQEIDIKLDCINLSDLGELVQPRLITLLASIIKEDKENE